MKNYSTRRKFLKHTAIVSLGFSGLQQWLSVPVLAKMPNAKNFGYGDLIPDPEGILSLPTGFTYKIISREGDPMADGLLTPGRADGMATFGGKNGRVILIRNHENSPNGDRGAFGKKHTLLQKVDKNKLYDYGYGKLPALGGTSTLIYNENTGNAESSYLSLAGTSRNCAGGMTPWNSWITCEETTYLKGEEAEKDHGYNFEVLASETPHLADPVPLTGMGRFNHEAVCVDPRTSIVYETEDRPDGLIYRYIPFIKEQLSKGGKLQVLAIKGQKSRDTRNWKDLDTEKFPKNKSVEVEWLDIDNVTAPEDDLRYQGFDKGAARFARGEGMWFGKDEIFFACTNGGENGKGQVFRYVPSLKEGQPGEKQSPGTLELFLEPNDENILQNCDNLTVAPWGDLVMCEDRHTPNLVGVTMQGECYMLAANTGYKSEFAGGVFSPSGKTFFVNIQGPGLTLAITGPWRHA
jgi:uncharacterized protein